MTPSDLEVLLHYYTISSPHPRQTAPAVREAIDRYTYDGILVRVPLVDVFRVTPKGTAWLQMILATPYPREQWIDPRTKEGL